MNNVNDLVSAVAGCKDRVILRSADGTEEYNLKSALSQLLGICRLCGEHGDEYEVFYMDRGDEGILMKFLRELQADSTSAA